MSQIVGVELTPEVARALVPQRWRRRARSTLEVPWDPERPEELVALLESRIGAARGIALSVGLGFLHLKHVKLPPAPAAERRRMLALEPDRFFPVQDELLVVALAEGPSLAFAAPAELLARWIQAFEEWAPVEVVEPAPLSLARALGTAVRDGSYSVPAGPEDSGLLELRAGELTRARRVPRAAGVPEAAQLPDVGGVPSDFLAPWGAIRGADGDLEGMLLPETVSLALSRRRLERVAALAAACVLSLGLALWAVDRSRERTLERTREALALETPRAREAVLLRESLASLDREAAAVGELAVRRTDPLLVLAALSERLPADATVQSVRASGDEWQVDGTSGNAAEVVPLLDQDVRFQDVRFLSGSTRFREGDRTYETFSIAFRASRAP